MWWRNGKEGNGNAAGSPSVAPGCRWRLSPHGPRNVTDNIWYADTDESIINMPGWGEWVRWGRGRLMSGWVGAAEHPWPARNG